VVNQAVGMGRPALSHSLHEGCHALEAPACDSFCVVNSWSNLEGDRAGDCFRQEYSRPKSNQRPKKPKLLNFDENGKALPFNQGGIP
jgi:hypothetical protein